MSRSWNRKKVKVSVPVISIGNISVGGTGKTPILATIARFLMDERYNVAVVSSAYGRTEDVPFVQPGYQVKEMPVSQTGDEVMLLAQLLPDAIFSVDRIKAVAAAKVSSLDAPPDIILVDDGFQHYRLHRDFDIVTYDAGIKAPLLKMFPYGVLREPKSSLKRADVIVITRAKFAEDIALLSERLKNIAPQAQVYSARFQTGELIGHNQNRSTKYLEDKAVLIFAGIGNFKAFHKQMRALTSNLDHVIELSDHQVYADKVLDRIKKKADKYGSEVIVTTGKDWYKVRHFDFGRELYYLSQVIDLDPGEEKLVNMLIEKTGIGQKEN